MNVLTAVLLGSLFTASTPARPSGAVLLLERSSPDAASRVLQAEQDLTRRGDRIMSQDDLRKALEASPGGGHAVDLEALERMLDEAEDREARFDTSGAIVLRQQVVTVYETTAKPSQQVAQLAARAAFGIARAFWADGRREEADRSLLDATRRFPWWHPDPARVAPEWREELARAHSLAQSDSPQSIRVVSDRSGTLWVDGAPLGTIERERVVSLAPGSHRLWVNPNDTAAPSVGTIDRESSNDTVTLREPSFQVASWSPFVTLRCPADSCRASLLGAGSAAELMHVVGLYPTGFGGPDGLWVDIPSGSSREWHPSGTMYTPSSIHPAFSAWYLVPFGVGQLAQKRYVAAGVWGGSQIGLAAWAIIAWLRHEDAMSKDNRSAEPSLRRERNLSAGLLYGAMAASILEAVIVGAATHASE